MTLCTPENLRAIADSDFERAGQSVRDALRAAADEIERLKRQSDWDYKAGLEMARAVRDLPEVAPVPVLKMLSHCSTFPADWNTGKAMQRKHGLDAIPPVTEYESGAGTWARIRDGLRHVNDQQGATEK